MTPQSELPAVDAIEALALVADNAVLIDVREQDEWDAGHAPQAQHVRLGTVADALESIPREVPVLVICRSGRRSQGATLAMRAVGIEAYNVDGGMQAWAGQGGSVVTDAGTAGTVI